MNTTLIQTTISKQVGVFLWNEPGAMTLTKALHTFPGPYPPGEGGGGSWPPEILRFVLI